VRNLLRTSIKLRIFGIILILLAIMLNPYTLGRYITYDGTIDNPNTIAKLIFFEIVLFYIGINMILKIWAFHKYNKRVIRFVKFRKNNLLLLGFSLLIGIILSFALLEIYFYFNENPETQWHRFDSEIGWVPNNGMSFITNGKTVSFNSLGFRGEEVDSSKQHIILVGDSVTFGYGVNDNETIDYYLNNKFENLQTINLGVTGYGLDQSYIRLKKSIDNLNPKYIIVIIYTGNDFEDTISDTTFSRKSKPLFILEDGELELINSDVKENSCINLFSKSWTLNKFLPNFLLDIICNTKTLDIEDGQLVISSLIDEINSLAIQHNSTILFVLSPKIDKDGNLAGRHNLFREILESKGYNYLDYYSELNGRNYDIQSLYLDYQHYTPEGNKLFSEIILDSLGETQPKA